MYNEFEEFPNNDMELITDPKEVAKLAEERADANWKFRAFLKGVDLGIDELDAIVHRHYEEVSAQIDCRECGNCCRKSQPVLQQDDVVMLARGLNISSEALTIRLLSTDEDDDIVFNKTPCPLLKGNLCSVYEHRPNDCRSFPHLHKDEFVFRLIGVVHNCSVCPIVFNVYERLKDEFRHQSDDFQDDECY
jgi:Fe-S-cluster containining protein